MNTPAKVSNRQIRIAVNNQASVVEAHRETLRALVNDELKTRRRVDALERGLLAMVEEAGARKLAGIACLVTEEPTLWGRLCWLLKGSRG